MYYLNIVFTCFCCFTYRFINQRLSLFLFVSQFKYGSEGQKLPLAWTLRCQPLQTIYMQRISLVTMVSLTFTSSSKCVWVFMLKGQKLFGEYLFLIIKIEEQQQGISKTSRYHGGVMMLQRTCCRMTKWGLGLFSGQFQVNFINPEV